MDRRRQIGYSLAGAWRRHRYAWIAAVLGAVLAAWGLGAVLTSGQRGVALMLRLVWSRPYHSYREAKQAIDEGDAERALRYLERGDALTRGLTSRNALGRLRAKMLEMKGGVLDELGRKRRAREAYAEALAVDPCNYALHIRYGKCLVDQGRTGEGEEILLKAFDFHPHADDVLRILVPLYVEEDRPGEAVELFERFRDAARIVPVDVHWAGRSHRVLVPENQSERRAFISLDAPDPDGDSRELVFRCSSSHVDVRAIRFLGQRKISEPDPPVLETVEPAGAWTAEPVDVDIFNTTESLYPLPAHVRRERVERVDPVEADVLELVLAARKPFGADVADSVRAAYRSADDEQGLEAFGRWWAARGDGP